MDVWDLSRGENEKQARPELRRLTSEVAVQGEAARWVKIFSYVSVTPAPGCEITLCSGDISGHQRDRGGGGLLL